MLTPTMRITGLCRIPVLGKVLSNKAKVTSSTVTPAASGLSVLLQFPRLDDVGAATFEALDAWLSDHPRATMIVVRQIPRSRRDAERLEELSRKHSVAVMLHTGKVKS